MQDPLIIAAFKMIFSLAFVLFLIWLAAKWFQKSQGKSLFTQKTFKVIDVLPLGIKEKLMLIQLGQEYLLLSIGQGGVVLLRTFNKHPGRLSEAKDLPSPHGDAV